MFESLNNNLFESVEIPFTTDGFEFKKLKDLDPKGVYRIYGFFVSEGKMYSGKIMSLITNNCFISLPARYVEKFTSEEKSAFWSGKYSLTDIKKVVTKSGNDTYIFNIIETNPEYVAPTKSGDNTPEIPFN